MTCSARSAVDTIDPQTVTAASGLNAPRELGAVLGVCGLVPFLDDTVRGIFAMRSPRHPNPIGISVVHLLAVVGSTLEISGVDLLDSTPVLDIKPYVPKFDSVVADRTGWLEKAADRVHEVSAAT